MLRPYFDQIHPRDVQYLQSERGQSRWFTNLDRQPLRALQASGAPGVNKPVIKAGLLGRLRRMIKDAA